MLGETTFPEELRSPLLSPTQSSEQMRPLSDYLHFTPFAKDTSRPISSCTNKRLLMLGYSEEEKNLLNNVLCVKLEHFQPGTQYMRSIRCDFPERVAPSLQLRCANYPPSAAPHRCAVYTECTRAEYLFLLLTHNNSVPPRGEIFAESIKLCLGLLPLHFSSFFLPSMTAGKLSATLERQPFMACCKQCILLLRDTVEDVHIPVYACTIIF